MLYHLLYPLHTTFSAFNVFRYITFRSIGATITAFLILLFVGSVALLLAFALSKVMFVVIFLVGWFEVGKRIVFHGNEVRFLLGFLL